LYERGLSKSANSLTLISIKKFSQLNKEKKKLIESNKCQVILIILNSVSIDFPFEGSIVIASAEIYFGGKFNLS